MLLGAHLLLRLLGAHEYALTRFVYLLHSMLTASLPLQLRVLILFLLLGEIIDGDRLVHHVKRMVHRLLLICSSRSIWARVFYWHTIRLLLVTDISRLAS